jgi:DNA-directed RNA polymerase specialized sigma24 family protein
VPAPAALERLDLQDVAQRCSEETELFFERRDHDPRYCFELFRRAIRARIERAWDLVYLQYRPLVLGWVTRHPAFEPCGEESGYLANRAFERMWRALTPERFERFPNLKSLLRYLQMCVASVIVDHARARKLETLELDARRLQPDPASSPNLTQSQALSRIEREEFWGEIDARLRSEKERRVVQESFVLGLKPRQVYERHPGTFANVNEIYRIKENVLARLRRDQELAKVMG